MTGRLCQDDDAISCEPGWTSRKRKTADVRGEESAEHLRTDFGKRTRLLDATVSQRREDGSGIALDKGHVDRHGHSYSRVYSDGNARVHVGDSHAGTTDRHGHSYSRVYSDGNARVHVGDSHAGTTINHNYFGLCAAMNMRLAQDIEPVEEAAILRLAAVIIVAAIANVAVQPFLLLRNALHRAIPHAVQRRAMPLWSLFGSRMVLFEDALGRFEHIDIDIVTDWTSFHYNLTRAFADQPGHRRVAIAGYRLLDQAQGTQLIDPRRPPPFARVFMRNKHVRMSIHFAWDEVSLECCPRCGLKQMCELERETICKAKACGFSYRGHIKESPIVELDDDDDGDGVIHSQRPKGDSITEQRANPRRQRPKNQQENPAWFSRITVSQRPEEIALLRDIPGIGSHHFDMLAKDSATQLVDTSVYRPSSAPYPVNNLQDIQSWDTQPPWPSPRTASLNAFLGDIPRTQGNSIPLPRSGESQKALYDSGAGLKRRAQSPIARERLTTREEYPRLEWNPARIFEQWNAAFGSQPNQHPDFGASLQNDPSFTPAFRPQPTLYHNPSERLQNDPSPTPATFGNVVPLNDPFIDITPRATRPNSHSGADQRLLNSSPHHPVAPGAGYDTGYNFHADSYSEHGLFDDATILQGGGFNSYYSEHAPFDDATILLRGGIN